MIQILRAEFLKRASLVLFCFGDLLEFIMVIKLVMFFQYCPTGKHERLILHKNSELKWGILSVAHNRLDQRSGKWIVLREILRFTCHIYSSALIPFITMERASLKACNAFASGLYPMNVVTSEFFHEAAPLCFCRPVQRPYVRMSGRTLLSTFDGFLTITTEYIGNLARTFTLCHHYISCNNH